MARLALRAVELGIRPNWVSVPAGGALLASTLLAGASMYRSIAIRIRRGFGMRAAHGRAADIRS
jgi:hypothetical protein